MKTPKDKSHSIEKRKLLKFFLNGSKGYFTVSIFMTTLAALADMLSPQIIRAAIDNAIGGQASTFPIWVNRFVDRIGGFLWLGKHLWVLAVAVLAVSVVKVCAQYLFRVYNTKASETLVKTMRDSLFGHIERLPFAWHMKHQTGDIIQRCTSDIETTRNFISEQMTNILRIAVLLSLSIFFMCTMNGILTLVAIIPMPVIIAYSVFFHRKLGRGFRECDEAEGKLSATAQENLTGVRVVRAFGREQYERDSFIRKNNSYTGKWVKMAELMSRFWCSSDILSYLQVMIVIAFGAALCVRNKMTAGEYVAFISYNTMLTWPIRELGRMIADMSKAGVSVERIMDIMSAKQETNERQNVSCDLTGDIVFDHVSFSYENSPRTLWNISMTIPAGSTVGILGGTGSGKSTLMYLLDRLYDLPADCGTITIGGKDIRSIPLTQLRRGIGIVLQEPFLFSRTLKENIAITNDEIHQEEIAAAAHAACLDETIQGFPKGYDTFVGERGVTLSGGQKQRTAIARTLVEKTPIMIFDDSLSAVDTKTDAKIRMALQDRFGTATIFLISHRITTLDKADLVAVLDKGRIVEFGTPQQLRQSGGIYQKIAELQAAVDTEVMK